MIPKSLYCTRNSIIKQEKFTFILNVLKLLFLGLHEALVMRKRTYPTTEELYKYVDMRIHMYLKLHVKPRHSEALLV